MKRYRAPVNMSLRGKVELLQLYAWAISQGYDPRGDYLEREDFGRPPPGTTLPEGMVSPHFALSEFACNHCGTVIAPPPKLVEWLEEIRAFFDNRPIEITSGTRCPAHNLAVDGASESLHLEGVASDIKVEGVSPEAVFNFVDTLVGDEGGAAEYETFVHLDARGYRARW